MRRKWLHLAARVVRLRAAPPQVTSALVSRSYDRVAPGYDEAWTQHMRAYALEMLNELDRYELNDLEDFIVNECEVIGDDEPNNLFRILMYENSSVGGDDELS